MSDSLVVDPVLGAYVLAFGVAAVACFASLRRALRIENDDLRRGLAAMLVTSGGWATAHVGFLVAPSIQLKLLFYYVGLIVGISAVGPWLYFCSAYTGRTFHRSVTLRRAAVALFLGIVAVKLTNPLHLRYFRAEYVTEPFTHLAVTHLTLHWLAMGLAYALATAGYFMLFELFWQVDHDTRPFLVLVTLTGLPVVLDVIGAESALLLDITYEPLGVAAFAVGVVFVYLEDFQTIKLTGDVDKPVVVLDDADEVREYNTKAKQLFPDIERGQRIDALVPDLDRSVPDGDPIIQIERAGAMLYYQMTTHSFTSGRSQIGRAITFSDITEREQYRAELERQNQRLERFANMISHDLRNPLSVATARVELLRERDDNEHLDATDRALERMEELIDDLLTLARQGQPVEETSLVSLQAIVERCWPVIDTKQATLEFGDDIQLLADGDRLQQLLENLIRNAIDHGGEDVTISVGSLSDRTGIYVADDGPGIPEADRDDVFESGYSTDESGTGFGLSIVAEIVEAHDWTIAVTESPAGGARFEITNVETADV